MDSADSGDGCERTAEARNLQQQVAAHMKSPYVSELQPNNIITANFLVQHKDIRQKKTGEPYLTLILGDRTGEIEAKMWDNVADVMNTFERDDFLRVRGLLQVFHNRLQLTVH